MKGTPRIRAFLPTRPRLPAPTRAGDAPLVFQNFGRTLGQLERAAAIRRGTGGDGA